MEDILEIPLTLVGAIMMIVGAVLMITPFCCLGLLVFIVGIIIFIVSLVSEMGRKRETVVYVPTRPRVPVQEFGAPVEQRFCTQCGGRIKPHDKFCGSCGFSIPGRSSRDE